MTHPPGGGNSGSNGGTTGPGRAAVLFAALPVDAKRCGSCGETKAVINFTRNITTADGLAPNCKQCAQEIKLEHYYGLSAASYRVILAEQGHCCAVCEVPAAESRIALTVDHDHMCCPTRRSCGNCIRGLICDTCNRAIGLMRDSAHSLRRAAEYLERHEVKQFTRVQLSLDDIEAHALTSQES